MMRRPIPLLWWILLLVAAVAVRFALAWFNTEANDNHLEVVQFLMRGEFPIIGSCWQCYHPKLFHLMGAGTLSLFQIDDPLLQWRGLQLLNVLLSAGTLTYLLLFLRGLKALAPWNFVAFLLWATNPKFAGISAQATNDTLVILAGTAFFFHAWRWLSGDWRHRLPMALAAGVAMASKGSGLAIVLLLGLVVALRFALQWRHHRWIHYLKGTGVALLLVLLVAIASLSGYWQNGRSTGSALALNLPADPFPSLFEESLQDRAGVTSIFHSFFTFPAFSLLQDPVIIGGKNAPAHRSNFWAQLWGRHSSPRFDYYPGVWQTTSPVALGVVRLSILLQSFAALLLLTGLLVQIRLVWKRWRSKYPPEEWLPQALLLVGLFGILALVIKLNLTYRSFFTMKAIYLYPAILPAAWLISQGGAAWFRRLPSIAPLLLVPLSLLALLGPIDSLLLADDLARGYGQQAHRLGNLHNPLPQEQSLTALPVDRQRQGWGGLRINQREDGGTIVAGGLRWSEGFSGHAPSEIRIEIPPGKYDRLTLQVAKDDLQPAGDGVQFAVSSGLDTLWRSGFIRYLDREKVEIAIPDSASHLLLSVDALGNNIADHSVWIAPKLRFAAE